MENQGNFEEWTEEYIIYCIENRITIPSDVMSDLIWYYGVETTRGEKHK